MPLSQGDHVRMASYGNIPYSDFPNCDPVVGLALGFAMWQPYSFPNECNVRPVVFYHNVAYPATGQTTDFEFWTANQADFTTNWMGGQNGLPRDTLFCLQGIGFEFDMRQTAAGVAIAGASPEITGGIVDTPSVVAAQYDDVMRDGLVRTVIADQVNAHEPVQGLRFFPCGVGTTGFGIATDSTTAAANKYQSFLSASNGSPNRANRGFEIYPNRVIYPGQTVKTRVKFAKLITITAACRLTCYMFGMLATKGTTN